MSIEQTIKKSRFLRERRAELISCHYTRRHLTKQSFIHLIYMAPVGLLSTTVNPKSKKILRGERGERRKIQGYF